MAAVSAAPAFGDAGRGLEISHLGTSNTIVRVTSPARYLLLPVEESVDDATVNVLLDGRREATLNVRLARNKVDYYVPLDISRYAGRSVLLDIVTAQSRATVREASDDACWTLMSLSDSFDTTNREKYRPAFHHTPLYGWMNDPNGMFYKDGRWHLYYQYNPYGSKWQNMTWGHSSSPDLVSWTHHDPAIEPDDLGTVFSGSCVVDADNTAGFGSGAVVALYTSAGVNQTQSLAWSNDGGHTFTKYAGNPVITLESEARDPNVFWHEATGEWVLLLAHALDHEMLIYTSPDLKNWTLRSSFGKGLGAQDSVWECPDLMQLPVDGTDERKWVLLCNLNPGGVFGGSATQYFVGDFDGASFIPDTLSDGSVPVKWMDHGKDHYATVSWSGAPDGRHVVVGWMSNWQYAAEVPTKQFRSANTLPRDIALYRASDGQYYLRTMPSPEVDALRGRKATAVRGRRIGQRPQRFALPTQNDGVCEILLTLYASRAEAVIISLGNDAGESVDMVYDPSAASFSFDRTLSGITDFNHDFPARTEAPLTDDTKKLSLRIFVDRSSIEIFDGEGRFVMTNLVFPTSPYTTLTLSATGGRASLSSLEVYSLNPIASN